MRRLDAIVDKSSEEERIADSENEDAQVRCSNAEWKMENGGEERVQHVAGVELGAIGA